MNKLVEALDYVYERTCINRDGEWTFKTPYDPQVVIDALSEQRAEPSADVVRARFEEWYNSTHKEPIHAADRRTDGDYRLGISGLWKSWKAAIAAMQPTNKEYL
jgi:hypothetical protein